MGIFDFMKTAGEKIFQSGDTRHEQAVKDLLARYGADYGSLGVEVNGSTVVLTGQVRDQAMREKAVLIAGNVDGIDKVDDRLTVAAPDFSRVSGGSTSTEAPAAPGVAGGGLASAGGGGGGASRFYTVKSGDSLSKIAREFYGDAGKYPQIFEANKPMLKDPDKIYPGQTLRIPPEA
jgi:nucleoid-associated protein YgaU